MFFTEQGDNFQIYCHLIGLKKSLSVRLFWKRSHLQNNSLWDQISIDGEPSFYLHVRKYLHANFSITSAFCTFYLLELFSWIKCFASAQLSKYIVLSVWFDLSASPLLHLCNFAEATIPPYSGHTVSVQSKKSNLPGAKYVHLAWPQLTTHICPTIWWLVT